jgi:hypothetical protein
MRDIELYEVLALNYLKTIATGEACPPRVYPSRTLEPGQASVEGDQECAAFPTPPLSMESAIHSTQVNCKIKKFSNLQDVEPKIFFSRNPATVYL